MRELVIGSTGFVGSNLCRHLPAAAHTARRPQEMETSYHFDLLSQGPLPFADIVYLCAGVNGTLTCANDPQRSWRVNVDGTIYVAEHYNAEGAFLVWISSTTVEWLSEHYGRQKRAAEAHLRAMPNVGIVRAGRVMKSNVDDLCRTMIKIGHNKERGLWLWGEDEKPYAH